MFDLQNGNIILRQSNFIITANTKKLEIEKHIPAQIAYKDEIGNGWSHYYCWLDMDDRTYVYAHMMFQDEHLDSIRILPQHQTFNIPSPRPNAMALDKAQASAYAWYCKHFERDELWFRWGGIRYCQGNDPIYHPTTVLIEFKHT